MLILALKPVFDPIKAAVSGLTLERYVKRSEKTAAGIPIVVSRI